MEISRRTVLMAGLAGVPLISCTMAGTQGAESTFEAPMVKVLNTCSKFDCGGKCIIKAHITDNTLTRVSTIPGNEINPDMPIMRPCVRGRNYRFYQESPDRLKYPMKRVGKRGEGKFERITWDEATTTIAEKITEIGKKYGPASRFPTVATASDVNDTFFKRLLALDGGYLNFYHSVSLGNTATVTPYTYGTAASGNSWDTLLSAKLVILWGHNPAETIFGHTNHYLAQIKAKGIKIILVDPRYSDTAIAYADEWIAPLPSTDTALMAAMAYVMVNENLHNKDFINRCCVGFDKTNMPAGVPANESIYAYLMGEKDGVKKTPEWAEQITKVPEDQIYSLARQYANAKPAALIQGWSPQRHYFGEQTARASTILASITGNVGVKGGWAGGYGGISSRKFPSDYPDVSNPVKASICVMQWMDAIENIKKVTPTEGLKDADALETPIKMIASIGGNYMVNQNPDVNKAAKLLQDESLVEFILVSDHFLTPTAKYADILLPDASFFERWGIGETWGTGNYAALSQQVLTPQFERRDDYDWMVEVARKMGIEDKFSEGRDSLGWTKYYVEATQKDQKEFKFPSFEKFQKTGIFYYDVPTHVAFAKEVKNPEKTPFKTPSGKIELFSKQLWDMKNPHIPAIPAYIPSPEGPEDPLTKQYPLQMITWKSKVRANSTFYGCPQMREISPQTLWINPEDAKTRGIASGETIIVHNSRGKVRIQAQVTPRVVKGVVAMQAGAWFSPDENGIDNGGCANVLSSDIRTPLARGNAHQTMLVQVNKEG